jgi:uncharacterized membrane protein YheB (UPF0754 family)
MKSLFLLLAPPVIGAVIGYVTNAAAIKMLFRPLKPVRLFGIRLPFTPGVLPRERHKLADSIGSMVERKLLTPELLRERILKEDVRAAVRASVAAYTAGVLKRPLGSLFAGKGRGGLFLRSLFRDFLSSPAGNSLIESFLLSLAGYAENSSVTLGELLGEEGIGILREKVESFVRENIESRADIAARYAASVLDTAYPDLASQLLQYLRKDEVHREMEKQGRIFLDNAVQKLSAFQRFFISAGQYDKTFRERMPGIIDDLIGQLEAFLSDPDTRRRFAGFAEERFRILVSRKTSLEVLSQRAASLAVSYLAMPLGEAVKRLASGDARAAILRIRELTGGEGVERIITGAARRFFDAHKDAVLSELFLVDGPKKEKIDAYAGENLLKIACGRIEGILKSINIRALVSGRIDSLEMVEVEHIVLDVMANQLKWINVFGAILGALIGGCQILFSRLVM